MLFSEAITELAANIPKATEDVSILTQIKSAINFAKTTVGSYCHWRNLEVPNNELVIIPQYTTGTATVVKDSRTVTLGGGGIVSSDFKGRFFRDDKSLAVYEILTVDTSVNTLALKTPIIEESGTYNYVIVKKWYRIPTNVRIILPNEDFDSLPVPLEIHGYDDYASDYSVACVVTEDSNVLTGGGFLGVVYPGDMIVVEANVYRVKSVDSDLQITMSNNAKAGFSGSVTFKSDTPHKAKLDEVSTDLWWNTSFIGASSGTKSILNYSYIRSLYAMVADDDMTELPHEFDRAILDIAKSEYGRANNSASWKDDLTLGQNLLQKLEFNRDLVWRSKQGFNLNVMSGLGRGTR